MGRTFVHGGIGAECNRLAIEQREQLDETTVVAFARGSGGEL